MLNKGKFADLKQRLALAAYKEIVPEEFKGIDKYEDVPKLIRNKVDATVDRAMDGFKNKLAAESPEEAAGLEAKDLNKMTILVVMKANNETMEPVQEYIPEPVTDEDLAIARKIHKNNKLTREDVEQIERWVWERTRELE